MADSSANETGPDVTDPGTNPDPAPEQNMGAGDSGFTKVINHITNNKIDAALWMTRTSTIVASILFFLPFFGTSPHSMYQKVLLANAATSALRLHQRLPNFQLSRDFFNLMFLEDSAHYLFYSLIFIMSAPVTMAIVPVFLFAVLLSTPFTKSVINQIGPNSLQMIRNLIVKIETNQRSILRFVACNEIFLMPMIIIMLFTGSGSLLQPFIYYRFLSLRYTSRRNPYCRQLFYELRMTTEQLCVHPSCPAFLANMATKCISLITRLAPATPT